MIKTKIFEKNKRKYFDFSSKQKHKNCHNKINILNIKTLNVNMRSSVSLCVFE